MSTPDKSSLRSCAEYEDFLKWWDAQALGDEDSQRNVIYRMTAWTAWLARSLAPSARNTILDECATALYERVESLVTMCDRAGYTREGSDLAQRVTATRDAIDIVRRLKSASTDGKADK